jgi:hypothetical protein
VQFAVMVQTKSTWGDLGDRVLVAVGLISRVETFWACKGSSIIRLH